MSERALVIIPTYMREGEDLNVTIDAVQSVKDTQPGVEILCVDDCSPNQDLVTALEATMGDDSFSVFRKAENSGFSKTVNVGLRRARDEGRDAVLLNADVEITSQYWLNRMRKTVDERGRPAAVVGALLMYPDDLIQHAGIYFSVLTRTFDHIYKYAPMNLPEAHRMRVCPVTGAFQFIRHETLMKVGIYDEEFFMGWEDVDYCLRVFMADESCVFNPDVRAYHFEQKFRGRPSPKIADWQAKSWMHLSAKYADANFDRYVPTI